MRLGGGPTANGLLTEEATRAVWPAWRALRAAPEGFAPQQVRAVATQTLREARKPRRLPGARAASTVPAHPIEVISGREEARLIFAGVARAAAPAAPDQSPVVDIGGRSTEMILGHGRKALHAETFQVGSVSLSMRYFGGRPAQRRGLPRRAGWPPAPSSTRRCRALRAGTAGAKRSAVIGHGGRGVAALRRQRHHRRPHHARRAALADRAPASSAAASTGAADLPG